MASPHWCTPPSPPSISFHLTNNTVTDCCKITLVNRQSSASCMDPNSDLNMLSDPEHPQALEHHVQLKTGTYSPSLCSFVWMHACIGGLGHTPLVQCRSAKPFVCAGGQRSPGVDPKQLAAELQKVSQQQAPGMVGSGVGSGGLGVLSALERSALLHSGTGSAASSSIPSPGQPASPAINKKQRSKVKNLVAGLCSCGEFTVTRIWEVNVYTEGHVTHQTHRAVKDSDLY